MFAVWMEGLNVGGWAWAAWRSPAAKRGVFLLERLVAAGQNGVRVRPLGGTRAGEMRITRFLRNPRVTPAQMFAAASRRTQSLVQGRHILAIQDTTNLRWRWLNWAHAAAHLAAAGAAEVTVIADRESDIYEEFAYRPAEVHLLVRAAQDRRLGDGQMLFDCTAALPELGRVTIELPAAPGRSARTATLALRARLIEIVRPGRPAAEKQRLPACIALHLVEALEFDPPPGVPPAHWRLLTTHAVTTLAEAQQITAFYRERWTIDIDQAWRLSRIKWWVGSSCNEAFWVEHRGSTFSPVQIRAADRREIAGQ